MFRRILVPLDGSPGAERAIPVAANLARKAGGSLVLLHVIAPTAALKNSFEQPQYARAGGKGARLAEAIEQIMAEAALYLTAIPRMYARDLADIPTETDIAFGTASSTLASTARLEQVDLIVLCRHQEAGLGQWGLESIAQQTVRHSPVPLLLLNEQERTMPVFDGTRPVRVLVPLDGSLFAETALAPALQLLAHCAGSAPRELCLVNVVDLFAGEGTGEEEAHMSPYTTEQARQSAQRYLQAIVERLRKQTDCEPDLHITHLVTSGVDVASTLLHLRKAEIDSEQTPSSLIALATHGREGLQRQIMGSIAERLLNAATTPLLIVCPATTTSRLINFALPAEGKK